MGCGASSQDKYTKEGATQPSAQDAAKASAQAPSEGQNGQKAAEGQGEEPKKVAAEVKGEEPKKAVEEKVEETQTMSLVPTGLKDLFAHGDDFLSGSKALKGSLGVVRIDYDYPPAPGDIDHPGSYDYEVFYRKVKGLTFEVCQSGKIEPEVETELLAAVKSLTAKGVSVIAADCGFMMWFQRRIREQGGALPVCMSSLCCLPSLTSAYAAGEKIIILTANGETLKPMHPLIKDECGLEVEDERYLIIGCEDVPGFDAVAKGEKVDIEKVTPGIIEKVQGVLTAHPTAKAILSECTELPAYSDALRKATGLPVFDAITTCDFFISSRMDNPRFGALDWDEAKKTKGSAYGLGDLGDALQDIGQGVAGVASDVTSLMLKPVEQIADLAMDISVASQRRALSQMARAKASNIKLGVVRLDYHYPPSPGDIDHPGSYPYEVVYKMVDGFTFEMCQSGYMSPIVETNFINAIVELVQAGVSVITGDCGFMMWFQALARKSTQLPVVMSSLSSLPTITSAYHTDEQIAIFTANGKTLEPMRKLIQDECNVDTEDHRYIVVGCEDVEGFEAVAKGEKVDVPKVTPGIVKKAKEVIAANPKVRAILFECTELPPYADAVRHATGLPVFDAITTCDFFMSSRMDNPRFGLGSDSMDGYFV